MRGGGGAAVELSAVWVPASLWRPLTAAGLNAVGAVVMFRGISGVQQWEGAVFSSEGEAVDGACHRACEIASHRWNHNHQVCSILVLESTGCLLRYW